MRIKNVIFFVSTLDSGGLENYLLRFLYEKHSSFDGVYVYCKSGNAGQLEEKYRKINNVHIVLGKLGALNLFSHIKLAFFIKKNRIDAVCDFTGNFSALPLLFSRFAGVKKRVASYRNSSDRFKKGLLKNTFSNFLKFTVNKSATNIIANSEAGLNYFYTNKWKSDKRFSVIRNGLNSYELLAESGNLRKDFGISDQAFVIGHTGRFNEAKNHSTILAVAEILLKKYQDIYFILCGNGVLENLRSSVVSKQLNERIFLFENRNDVPRFLNTMNCYFFPSITEGQPNALIEAMVLGLPYVASDIASIRETASEHYKLYDPLDVEGLSEALEKLYLNNTPRDISLQKETCERFEHTKRFDDFYRVLSGM
ncbi:glycosyltransferase [Pseudoalteromonas sp. NC201]|uniref:glycosyltransferase n=1 Tax=Pseudoalteromonas sp. NC201 TaxID=1514074 RepID=UPI000C7C7C4D|nr:glycosyltransferase [Pseudoalteromonas sp. NC201]AUJ68898.1 Putative glycosyltransferase EpsF [Pseudoalteromonas sp. NC201]